MLIKTTERVEERDRAVERGAPTSTRGDEAPTSEQRMKKIIESSHDVHEHGRASPAAPSEQAKGSKQVTDALAAAERCSRSPPPRRAGPRSELIMT